MLIATLSYEVLQLVADYLTAFATISVVFLGVWFRDYVDKKNRPNLELDYSPDLEVDNKYLAPYHPSDDSEEVWIRVRILNKSRVVARDVELRLLWSKREKGDWDNRPSWWFKASNLNVTSLSIYPGFEQPFDIAYVKNNVHTQRDFDFYLVLVSSPLDEWLDQKNKIEADPQTKLYIGGAYTVLIALLCSNSEPKYYKMELNVLSPGPENKLTNTLLGEQELKSRIACKLLGQVDPINASLIKHSGASSSPFRKYGFTLKKPRF